MSSDHPSQLHKQRVAALFDRVAAGFDNPSQRFFPFGADRMTAYLRPRPGEKVLDVATGTGAVAVAAAQAVRPGGRVMAVDLSERMLDRADANARKMALENVDFHDMDAEHLEFRSGYFDALACGFAVFLFPEPEAAVGQWRRVLRPGGRAAFSAFAETAFGQVLDDLLVRLRDEGADPDPRWFRRMSAEQCETLLASGGFAEVEVRTAQLGYHLANVIDWWEVVMHTSLRALLEPLAPDRREGLKRAHLAAVERMKTEDGIRIELPVHYAVGRAGSKA